MASRILFLYISSDSGHQHAADAVREACAERDPAGETIGVDAFSFAFPTIGKIISRTYLEILKHTPVIWDFIYDNPDVVAATRELRGLLNLMSIPKTRALVKQHRPQALVCTQAVPCTVFAAEKRRGHLHIPLIAVITDFAIHSYWIHPEVDFYCVPTEEVRHTLIVQGVPSAKIAVTGIPIKQSFRTHRTKEHARHELKLDPHAPALLVMGGSQGLGPLPDMVRRLRHDSYQCLVVTGVNRELHREMKDSFGKDKRVHVYGYTKQISLMMDAADILITKPGGLTSSEALAKGLPMIITHPLPGQEERNTRFLLKAGVAIQADDLKGVTEAAHALLNHPARLKRMTEKAQAIAHPMAATDVAQHIFRLIR